MNDTISRSWFAVLNNPKEHGYSGTPEEIIEQLKFEWINDNSLRKGWWGYCISSEGLHHVHMILEDSGSCRFSKVKRAYPKAHLEATKGNKKQVLAYINKQPPFDEKGEKVITFTSFGNIEGHKKYSASNTNELLSSIELLIDEGYTPAQIMREDIRFRREESLIRKCYFDKRYKETPPIRNVDVIWHCGESGSGKSFSYVKLCEEVGDENIFFFSDYANHGIGGFDSYCGEKYLFIDELKQHSLPFELLLTITQGYRAQLHCRYANSYALWTEIHITSIYSPEEIYCGMVDKDNQEKDPISQLLRRINKYIYHYKNGDEYKTYELPSEQYKGYEELKKLARGNEWSDINYNDIPFE